MCGIIGGISKKVQETEIQKMISVLKHRGPDSNDYFFDKKKNVFLGHTRLSVIDLSEAGKQPMVYHMESVHKNIYITFNGEIYNYKEIRKELIEIGHDFDGESDTEVVLKSYIEWGIDCVNRFHGMFAFAIWDEFKSKFYLFRDRFGVKPLYYYVDGNDFYFASELKALYQLSAYKKEIDFKALGQYFQFGYIPAPQTIFKNTFKLKQGSYLEVDLNGSFTEPKSYWSPSKYTGLEKFDNSEDEIIDNLEEVLQKSFKYRMVADVDVGIFLSGGVDSSLVAALLQKNSPKKIKTFTIGFNEKEYNEACVAKQVAEHLGTDHKEYYLSANDVKDSLHDYINIFDEPFGDSSALLTYLLAKNTREQVKVALSGDGGDELFFGYSKYEALAKLSQKSVYLRHFYAGILNLSNPHTIDKFYKKISNFLPLPQYSNFREKISKLSNVLKTNGLLDMFVASSTYWQANEVNSLFKNNEDINQNNFVLNTDFNEKNQMQLWDLQQYLPDDILVKTDRASMAVGLEAREPFLDQDVWEFVLKIPDEIRCKNFGSKYLLKKILSKHLPEELFSRPKTGFRLPMYEWLKGDWSFMLDKYLNKDFIKNQNIFSCQYVEQIVKKWKKDKYVNPDKLWLLLSFQMWYEKWVL